MPSKAKESNATQGKAKQSNAKLALHFATRIKTLLGTRWDNVGLGQMASKATKRPWDITQDPTSRNMRSSTPEASLGEASQRTRNNYHAHLRRTIYQTSRKQDDRGGRHANLNIWISSMLSSQNVNNNQPQPNYSTTNQHDNMLRTRTCCAYIYIYVNIYIYMYSLDR